MRILKIHLPAHLCKFAIGVNNTSGKFLPLVSMTPAINLPRLSTTRWQIMESILDNLHLKVKLKKKNCLYVKGTQA
jgi:hypothetical protein